MNVIDPNVDRFGILNLVRMILLVYSSEVVGRRRYRLVYPRNYNPEGVVSEEREGGDDDDEELTT